MRTGKAIMLASTKPLADMDVLTTIFQVDEIERSGPHSARSVSSKRVVGAVGWGMKESALSLKRRVDRRNIQFYHLEDGFLGYDTHPSLGGKRLSLVIDDLGIYFDASKPSRLEKIIASHADWFIEDVQVRGAEAFSAMIEGGFSKYNHGSKTLSDPLFFDLVESESNVLVVDQVQGDLSIPYSGAREESFRAMLEAAVSENPNSKIFIKLHPDHKLKKGGSYLGRLAEEFDVKLIDECCSPLNFLNLFNKVYTVSSFMGFEALMMGCEVVTFGTPFYAGWGLTDDRLAAPSRRTSVRNVTPAVLFAAAYLQYPVYLDPCTGQVASIERVLAHLSLERKQHQLQADVIHVEGFSLWKRRFIKRYFNAVCPGSKLVFHRKKVNSNKLSMNDALVLWGHRGERVGGQNHKVWVIEDGFIRSCGLGADLASPASLAIDDVGVHYDIFGGSRLENILLATNYSQPEIKYARSLIDTLRANKVSKYNVGLEGEVTYRSLAGGKQILLVVGQVESDRSIQYSAADVWTDFDLLVKVKKNNPDAFIIYKPHPDVVSKSRLNATKASELDGYYDLVESEYSISSVLDAVDEVHSISSLAGFEALVRGLPVHCYGTPFYSSWGLTVDHGLEPVWRDRKLTIEELVLGSLCLYPIYYSWSDKKRVGINHLLESLKDLDSVEVKSAGTKFAKVKNLMGVGRA